MLLFCRYLQRPYDAVGGPTVFLADSARHQNVVVHAKEQRADDESVEEEANAHKREKRQFGSMRRWFVM